jgi:hypothetical protein
MHMTFFFEGSRGWDALSFLGAVRVGGSERWATMFWEQRSGRT